MQNFEIVLNKTFTAATQIINSGLQLDSDYFVYINSNGGGLVNPYNVRGYFNDPRNQQTTNDFFSYLTGHTSSFDQVINIISSDQKLSNVFNDYYLSYVLSSSTPSTSVIQQNLSGTTEIIASTFDYNWDGSAMNNVLSGTPMGILGATKNNVNYPFLDSRTDDESYYVPVYIGLGSNQLARYQYDICDLLINSKTIGLYPSFSAISNSFSSSTLSATTADTRIHTLLNCFVDINLETNENVTYNSVQPKVSFQFPSYNKLEGDIFSVRIGLDSPSLLGVEQAGLNIAGAVTNQATIGLDYNGDKTYPFVMSWLPGEQYKYLNFTAYTDYYIEPTETFQLEIYNLINCDAGTYINSNVNIVNTTVLRTVSLSVAPPQTLTSFLSGEHNISINEGESVTVTINLDGPAFGVEVVTISLVNSSVLFGGVVSVGNPLSPSDFTVPSNNMTFSFAPGETQKTFTFTANNDFIIENSEDAIFELQNPQFCLLDITSKALVINVNDTTVNLYKYAHLNLGSIYSEIANNGGQSELKRFIPSVGPIVNPENYAQTFIKYGDTLTYTNWSFQPETWKYLTSLVKVKITNLGTITSSVNGVSLNSGQHTTIGITGNDFIITAQTNDNQVSGTYQNANYKVEIINNYAGRTSGTLTTNSTFTLRAIDNVSAAVANTLELGSFNLPGMTTNPSNVSGQYKLVSKYKNANTGRINTGSVGSPVYVCPSTTFGNLYENFSINGILFLNYSSSFPYTSWPSTHYESFDFIQVLPAITCAQVTIPTGDPAINFNTIPFKLEP